MAKSELPERTIEFALRIIKVAQKLDEKAGTARILSNQLLRAGTSIGANVSEGQGAQSEADFLTKLSIALKEARETQYWLTLIVRSELFSSHSLSSLTKECDELIAILTASCKTLKAKRSS